MGATTDFEFGRLEPFSFALWVKLPTDDTDTDAPLVGRVSGTGDLGWTTWVRGDGGDLVQFSLLTGDEGGNLYARSETGGERGRWTFVGGTYDGSALGSGVRMWVNTSSASGDGARVWTTDWSLADASLAIGHRPHPDTDWYASVQLSTVAVFNRELSCAEMEALAVGDASPPETAGLLGYWPLDEGTGAAAVDASGNGNDGAHVGGPTWTLDCP